MMFRNWIEYIKTNRNRILLIASKAVLYLTGFALALLIFGAIAFAGFTGAMIFLLVAVAFFSIAWLPFAPVIIVVGIFSHPKSIMTYRAKSALLTITLLVLVLDANSLKFSDSGVVSGLDLPEEVFRGYAAVLVSMLFLGYLRFCYLDGLTKIVEPQKEKETSSDFKVLSALSLPSAWLIYLLIDLIVPTIFAATVASSHGCDGLAVAQSVLSEINTQLGIWGEIKESLHELMKIQEIRDVFEGVANMLQQSKQNYPEVWRWLDSGQERLLGVCAPSDS